MPHLVVECTDNLKKDAQFKLLFPKIHEYLASTQLFPIGGVRSRVHWLETWEMARPLKNEADQTLEYAFVHFVLSIGHGRSLEDRKRVGDAVFELIKTHFKPLYAQRLLALSFQMNEIDPVLNYKQNNIHALFK
ncbi:5-carboxymethyl-2-hydroxymuconate isomerase [Gammaproteobacteria bacterium]|nr:5-carboxymethyl-2-hydroxymuconate isomerase [Gammaproteobacteria bacterium]